MTRNRRIASAAALLAIQVIHAAIPADTSSEGYFGAVVGLIFVVASVAALIGVTRGRSWAPRLLGATGLAVAAGFVLYHVTPFHTPVTNPYFGEDNVGALQWTPVVLCVVVGLWAAWEARTAESPRTSLA